jgi:hypothetical protein
VASVVQADTPFKRCLVYPEYPGAIHYDSEGVRMHRVLVALLILFAWPLGTAGAVTDTQVTDAIKRMQVYLLSQQDTETGSWEKRYTPKSYHYGGESALVTFALLRSGLSVQEQEMRAAADFLKTVEMSGTYAISLRAHCWAALSNDYRHLLADDAGWLLRAQVDGLFDYGPRTGPRYDHSVTQYGLLGLWESAKRKGPTAGGVWQRTAQHFIESQNDDGGWGYSEGNSSTSPMTAAGLTALLIAQERLYLGRNKPPPKLAQAIEKAITKLDHEAMANGLHNSSDMYYLVSLERAALASGIKTLGGRDWFDAGAEGILNKEHGTGSYGNELVDTAFALMFLSRGRTPVWINKLRLSGQAWNNRPNDLNILTRQLSDIVEEELNWQVVDADADFALWLNAPVAYVASDGAIELSTAGMANLKTYLDLGGVLVATADGSAQAFGESVRQIASQLYPGYTFERAGSEHPLMGLVFQVDLPEDKRPWVLSNGVRDLIILAPSDWGISLQSSRADRGTSAKEIMANLHALVTDRGRIGVRLESPFVVREDKPSRGVLKVTRGVDIGNDMIEPLAWLPFVNQFFNRTGLDLAGLLMPLDEIGRADTPLVHLGGGEICRLSAPQLRGLVQYINRGGTVLVETIGGRGGFADEVLRQLEAVFGEEAAPLALAHPIITGEGLAGGYDQCGVGYRRYSTLNKGLVETPRLEAIWSAGRPIVIASREDMSLGVLGSRRWGVDGYDIESARRLLTNILLFTAKGKRQNQEDASTPSTNRDINKIEVTP